MPKQLKVDWGLVQALYLQGMTLPQISKKMGVKYNTLKKRCHRYHWRLLKKKTRQNVQEAVQKSVSQSIPELSKKVRQTLAEHLEKTALTLPKHKPPKNFGDIYSQQKAVEKLVNNSGKVFGWNDDSQGRPSLINVAILNQLKDGETVLECDDEGPSPETGKNKRGKGK